MASGVSTFSEGWWLIQVRWLMIWGRKRGTISWMRFCLKQDVTTAIQALMLRWFQSLPRMPCHFSKLWFYCTCWHIPTCLVFTHPAPWNCKASSDGPGETNSFHGQTRLGKPCGGNWIDRDGDRHQFPSKLKLSQWVLTKYHQIRNDRRSSICRWFQAVIPEVKIP